MKERKKTLLFQTINGRQRIGKNIHSNSNKILHHALHQTLKHRTHGVHGLVDILMELVKDLRPFTSDRKGMDFQLLLCLRSPYVDLLFDIVDAIVERLNLIFEATVRLLQSHERISLQDEQILVQMMNVGFQKGGQLSVFLRESILWQNRTTADATGKVAEFVIKKELST